MITIWVATTNQNKLKEIQNFFKDSEINWKTLKDLPDYSSPEENGKTFTENASIKSHHLLSVLKNSQKESVWILGEDSGLEVLSLKGAPGIYSARYGGLEANDQKNNDLLLKNLKNIKNRQARYVCAISLLSSDKKEYFFEGFCNGSIHQEEKGCNGFGYDSLFIPQGENQTFGELPPEFKSQISHRSQALTKLQETVFKEELF